MHRCPGPANNRFSLTPKCTMTTFAQFSELPDTAKWLLAREVFLMLLVKKQGCEIGRIKAWKYQTLNRRLDGKRSPGNVRAAMRLKTIDNHFSNCIYYAVKKLPPFTTGIRSAGDILFSFGYSNTAWLKCLVKSNIPLNILGECFFFHPKITLSAINDHEYGNLKADYIAIDKEIPKLINTKLMLDKLSIVQTHTVFGARVDLGRVKIRFDGPDLKTANGILSSKISIY